MQLLHKFMNQRSDAKKNAVGFGLAVEGCYRFSRIITTGIFGGDLEN